MKELPIKPGKQVWTYLLIFLGAAAILLAAHKVAVKDLRRPEVFDSQLLVQAKVGQVMESTTREDRFGEDVLVTTLTRFSATLLDGEYKGMELTCLQVDDPTSPYKLRPVRAGDRVFVRYTPEVDGDVRWSLQEYIRTDALIVLAVLLMVFLLLIGRAKGLSTILSLVLTCLAIFAAFIPAILSGHNIYLWTILVSIYIVSVTILLVNGPSKKSLCAGTGCVSGLAMSGLLIAVMDIFLGLTGYLDEDSILLLYIDSNKPIDLKAVIFAAIMVGALGAVMDVSISIASALHELQLAAENPTMPSLMRSGMNIARDIIGTMSNTLLLAYIGSSLSLVLLLVAYNNSLMALLNKELIVVEILQALVGVAGLLFVIPLTSLVCSYIYSRGTSGDKAQKG